MEKTLGQDWDSFGTIGGTRLNLHLGAEMLERLFSGDLWWQSNIREKEIERISLRMAASPVDKDGFMQMIAVEIAVQTGYLRNIAKTPTLIALIILVSVLFELWK